MKPDALIATISFVGIVSACGIAPDISSRVSARGELSSSCICASYLNASPRPDWVDAGDIVTHSYHQSTGVSACTGLQKRDTEKADLSARSKLGRVLNTKIESSISETRTDYGRGTSSARASITSNQQSKALLKNSKIAQRWVDPNACVVYAVARLSIKDAEEAKRKIANRLINQTFYINTTGDYADLTRDILTEILSQQGISKISKNENAAAHQFRAKFHNISLDRSDGTVLRGQLNAEILSPDGTLIWQNNSAGKGISFQSVAEDRLVDKAIRSAARVFETKLKDQLQK